MAIKTFASQAVTWVNIDSVDEEAINYLKEKHNFHHLDIEDIRGESQTPKIDTYKNYLFIVLQFPYWHPQKKRILNRNIDVFIGDSFLITIQHTKSKEIKNFFYRCMKNKRFQREWMNQTSGHLLYKLLESLFKDTQPILNKLGQDLTLLEQTVFEGNHEFEVVTTLALHRRNILTLRRVIDPQRYLISNLTHIRKPFLHEDTTLYFDNISDYLNKLWAIIDSYKETVEGLHVTVESLITQRTNKVVSTLTAMSVVFLPYTVLSGIYGMNILGLPYAKNPIWVWAMFLVLTITVLITLIILKKRRWI
ncbi:magnesium transporter CorA family protein [Patescibacteria group bacterium]|nr:magnesium transporter CorA family protein [Patescibacteria group bacterium]MBU1721715.1 magnesium transporter CorA family protein [Patescibacteria group bacterium]MBU1901870.1 magnesium transporter CorA family protein [Patescibacteria group bacterium]